MKSTAHSFPANARAALGNEQRRRMLERLKNNLRNDRAAAVRDLPEFDALRDAARAMKDHVLTHLDFYLETFEANVIARGGHVHWCRTAEDARRVITEICQKAGAKTVTKGKSMIAEEIALNDHLEANGITPIETDLGEYIIQLRGETPSHIVGPANHLSKEEVSDTFRECHTDARFAPDRPLETPIQMVSEARSILREHFLAADVGITGANMLVADTGTTVIVTNEGNGDLTQLLPRVHVVLASIEKAVPTLEDGNILFRLLARSATGQEMSTYTTYSTGPRLPEDPDGPEEYHVVLLDNGRSSLLGTPFQDLLRCIRCGACMNHCPVYGAIGGHAYGWVYPGPIGSALNPMLLGLAEAHHLPNASSLCGRCESVCPMRIPLPDILRRWRVREHERKLSSPIARFPLSAWAMLARRPWLYRPLVNLTIRCSGILGRALGGRLKSLPLAGGWTKSRDLPLPSGPSFMTRWARGERPERMRKP